MQVGSLTNSMALTMWTTSRRTRFQLGEGCMVNSHNYVSCNNKAYVSYPAVVSFP